jgi:DNA repair protein RecO (recombination protein O)
VARARSSRGKSFETAALVVRRVEYGESDLVLGLFTEKLGRISALARGARRSRRRFGGVLEIIHTLGVRVEERAGVELLTLSEAKLVTTRPRLVMRLDRIEAAGRALNWVRHASPPRTPEPEVWRVLVELLDRLDDPDRTASPRTELAEAGLRLISAFGWGLDFDRCVSCGKPAPEGRAALIDVTRGGLVCRECGGARLRLAGATRARLSRAARGAAGILEAPDVDVAVELVDLAFRAHLGFE